MLLYWIVLLIVFFLLWFFLGRQNTQFIGLNPLFSNQPLPQDPFRITPFFSEHLKGKHVPDEQRISIITEKPKNTTQKKNLDVLQSTNRPSFLTSKGQKICCQVMEEIYNEPFSCSRPSWLKNPETGGILEIDCYNEKLKIGVEYNGIQHYVYPNIYHKSLIEFKNQVRRDQYKIKKCKEQGVYLISVPYNVPHEKIKSFIMDRLPQENNQEVDDEEVGDEEVDDEEVEDEEVEDEEENNQESEDEDTSVDFLLDEFEYEEEFNNPTSVCFQA